MKKNIRIFYVQMLECSLDYTQEEFRLYRIDGPVPLSPELGDIIAWSTLSALISNGNIVHISPADTDIRYFGYEDDENETEKKNV